MAAPTFLKQPAIQRIPALLDEVKTHQIIVPRFQRPFVWTDEQRVELMRSIYEGLPIGSLLVWRTEDQPKLAAYRLPGSGPLEDHTSGVRQFLLDGHQRVTTLFTALVPPALVSQADADDDDERAYRELRVIFFDLEDEVFVLKRHRATPPPTWLPVSVLFDSYALHEFQGTLKKDGASKEVVNRADEVSARFKDYLIPVIPIVTDDIETATKSFQRVNSAGTKMSEVHMASALAFSSFDLNEKIGVVKAALRDEGWKDLDEQRVLDTCKAILGLEIRMRTVTKLVDDLRQDESVLARTQVALVAATRFLRRKCDIHGPSMLPYSYQIVLLAAVLDTLDGPDDETYDNALSNWLWATTYAEYFSGMSGTGLRRAREHLKAVVDGKRAVLPHDLNRKIGAPGRFDLRSARARAMALTLAELYPADGKGVQRDRFGLLAEHGAAATGLLFSRDELGDTSLVESLENRFLGDPKELNQVRDMLRDGLFDHNGRMSHAIDTNAARAVQKGDYVEVLKRRRRFLVEREREFATELNLEYDAEH